MSEWIAFDSLSIDLAVCGDRLPGETVCADTLTITPGGKGDGFPIRDIDTVGAGDAFLAGLTIAMDRGRGALACARRGAQKAMPSLAEVEAILVVS